MKAQEAKSPLLAKSIVSRIFSIREMGTIIPLIILYIVIAFVNPNFFAPANLIDVVRATSYTFILAAPLTCLMLTGNRDLSVGATTALGGVACAWGLTSLHWGIIPSILLGLFAGLVVGLVKCFIVLNLKLPPFIITLGLQYIINGFVLVTTLGNPITGFPKAFTNLGQGRVFGVFYTIIFALVLGIAIHLMLRYTRLGREIYATGGNKETARLAGINTTKVLMIVHVAASVFAALVGILYASRFNAAQSNAGAGTEMTIMAAIIIGGTSFAGGSGTVIGSLFGCLLLASINNGLVLMHVSSYWQNLVFGAILVISLLLDKIRTDKSGGGL